MGVRVIVCVIVGVMVEVAVTDGVGVMVGVLVIVGVLVMVGVDVTVDVGVMVGVFVGGGRTTLSGVRTRLQVGSLNWMLKPNWALVKFSGGAFKKPLLPPSKSIRMALFICMTYCGMLKFEVVVEVSSSPL